MSPSELSALLSRLLAHGRETGWIEFKHNNFNPQDIGEYISALANTAVLERQDTAYLVWGVEDSTFEVVGTTFRPHATKQGNEDLEHWLTRLLDPQVNFRIHAWPHDGKPMVLFEIPKATDRPVSFAGTRYIRIGSYTKRLDAYDEKQRELWLLLSRPAVDWSAPVCPEATLDALDPQAIAFARRQYRVKFPKLADEIDGWDDATFLNKAKVTINGRPTRTAILLLGKEESAHYLSPAVAQISWILKDAHGIEKDYAHFGPPFLLNVDAAYRKVRNLTLRVPGDGTLFLEEVSKYDDWVVREALHNCIAHQDYTQAGRINFIEEEDALLLTNRGHFMPESIERVIERDAPEEQFRNPFLVQAMVNLNMIDTIGSGIKQMFRRQKERFLPMPDYDLTEPQRVKVRIIGKILSERFTRLLLSRTDLTLEEVIALDRVQKHKPITPDAFRTLKRGGLVEGRRTQPLISAMIAAVTGQEADYIHQKGFDRTDCKRKMIDYLTQFNTAGRQKFEEVLFPMLSTTSNERQKRDFVKNLIQEMRREGTIQKLNGERAIPVWVLSKPGAKPNS